MMKKKSPLYYICLILVFIGIFKYYEERKEYEKQIQSKTESSPEIQNINIGFDKDLIQNISKIANNLKDFNNAQQAAKVGIQNTIFVYYGKWQQNLKQVGLCANYYNIEIEGFAENGEVLMEKKIVSSLSFKEYPEFYNTLNKALTLTGKNQRIEIFTNNLSSFPTIFRNIGNLNQSGIIFITNTDILGKTNFDPSIVSGVKTLEIKDRKREQFQFFCKEKVAVIYSISTLEDKIITKEIQEEIFIGESQNKKEELLEYLILNSYNGVIEGAVPAVYFIPNSKIKKIKIKGTIVKKSEA